MPKSKKRQRSLSTSKPQGRYRASNIEGDASWIAALACKAASDPGSSGRAATLSKEERIARRRAKKRRRGERSEELRDNRVTGNEADGGRDRGIPPVHTREAPQRRRTKERSALNRLAQEVEAAVNEAQSSGDEWARKTCYYKSWIPAEHNVKGKATAGQKKLTQGALQPRKCDYGGLGVARPSQFLDLHDPSFVPKFEEEFIEHIPGFFGKQRTKAMKKQLDGDMLWRRLTNEKKGRDVGNHMNKKIGGRKLSGMTPDERVEAMMNAGVI